MPGVTEEQITAAKQMSAIEFLRRYRPGELVKTDSRGEFELREHDSFKINEETSFWHWKSRDAGGRSALDYLVKVEGVKFVDAVLALKPTRIDLVVPKLQAVVAFQQLPEAAALLHRAGFTVPSHKPVLGNQIFAVESGIHVDGIAKNPALYEAYAPESVGLERSIVVGKHSGRAALRLKAAQLGIDLPEAREGRLLAVVQKMAVRQQHSLSDRQFAMLCESITLPSGRKQRAAATGAKDSTPTTHAATATTATGATGAAASTAATTTKGALAHPEKRHG